MICLDCEKRGELYCVIHGDADTITVPTETKEPTVKDLPAEDKEDGADARPTTGGAKPPADGLCRNCRRRVTLNRFKLCYPCWVEGEIKDREKKEGREWKAGEPHPAWCGCEGLGEHKNRDGSSKGNN